MDMKVRLLKEEMPILRLEVEDGTGNVLVFDPNQIIMWAIGGGVFRLKPGKIKYRSHDFEITCDRPQLNRLVHLSLTKREYFSLIRQIGIRHEWHEDFYSPDDGEALQPVEKR